MINIREFNFYFIHLLFFILISLSSLHFALPFTNSMFTHMMFYNTYSSWLVNKKPKAKTLKFDLPNITFKQSHAYKISTSLRFINMTRLLYFIKHLFTLLYVIKTGQVGLRKVGHVYYKDFDRHIICFSLYAIIYFAHRDYVRNLITFHKTTCYIVRSKDNSYQYIVLVVFICFL